MARERERRIFVNLRKRFALLEHLLEPKHMSVYALAVCSPSRVLSMACNSTAEERRALCVLLSSKDTRQYGTCSTKKELLRTVALGSTMASTHALLCSLAARMTSVRPRWNFRVCALSYVTAGRPLNL